MDIFNNFSNFSNFNSLTSKLYIIIISITITIIIMICFILWFKANPVIINSTGVNASNYQTIVYTVPNPKVGQKVKLQRPDTTSLDYEITSIDKSNSPYDAMTLQLISDTVSKPLKAVVINGEWKLFNISQTHTLIFTP